MAEQTQSDEPLAAAAQVRALLKELQRRDETVLAQAATIARLERHIDRAWAMLANCYDVESREECERSPLVHDGFLPLEMAIHAVYKRDRRPDAKEPPL